MEMTQVLLIIWGTLTTALVVLLIYRSTLKMHEEDQLFLDENESSLEKEQMDLRQKVGRVTPYVNWLGAASGALILFIGAMWLYRGLSTM